MAPSYKKARARTVSSGAISLFFSKRRSLRGKRRSPHALASHLGGAQTREAPTGPHLGQLTADEPRLSSSLDVHVLNTIVLFSTLGVVEAV